MSRPTRRQTLLMLLSVLTLLALFVGIAYACLEWEISNPLRIRLTSKEEVENRKFKGVKRKGHMYHIDVENPSATPVYLNGAAVLPSSSPPHVFGLPELMRVESSRPAGSDIAAATGIANKYPITIPPRSIIRLTGEIMADQREREQEWQLRIQWSSSRRYHAHQWLARQSRHLPAYIEIRLPTFIPKEEALPLDTTSAILLIR